MIKNGRLLLATGNRGKIAELAPALAGHGLELLGLDAFPDMPEVEETGATFEENALLKARASCKFSGLVAIADDSGLAVDWLGGAPGVHSARYGADWQPLPGENRDGRNIRKLLHAMANVPPEKRACHFRTVMAAVAPDGRELVVNGRWDGFLLEAPRGANGFGYDPVFLDPDLGRTAAELSREEKNARSHRGKALRALLERLPAFISGADLS